MAETSPARASCAIIKFNFADAWSAKVDQDHNQLDIGNNDYDLWQDIPQIKSIYRVHSIITHCAVKDTMRHTAGHQMLQHVFSHMSEMAFNEYAGSSCDPNLDIEKVWGGNIYTDKQHEDMIEGTRENVERVLRTSITSNQGMSLRCAHS